MPTTTRQALMIGGISFLTAGLTYCLYFDYKRRNDPGFRKKLLKEQRRLTKQKQVQGINASREVEQMLGAAVAAVNAEPLLTTIEGKEQFFMEQVGMGETLSSRMPHGAVPAAIAFFKAYKVYPSPQELMMIFQRTMPPQVFGILVEMIKIDVNQTLSASRNSSSIAAASRRSLNSEDPVIEEITGEERAILDALKSGVPSLSSASRASPAKASSEQPKTSSVASGPALSTEPSTHSVAEPASTAVAPQDSSPLSAPPSEYGSIAAGSQNGHSFVLVGDDGSSAQQVGTPEVVEKSATENDLVDVEHVQVKDETAMKTEEIKKPDHADEQIVHEDEILTGKNEIHTGKKTADQKTFEKTSTKPAVVLENSVVETPAIPFVEDEN